MDYGFCAELSGPCLERSLNAVPLIKVRIASSSVYQLFLLTVSFHSQGACAQVKAVISLEEIHASKMLYATHAMAPQNSEAARSA
jgi:hypothetical protein